MAIIAFVANSNHHHTIVVDTEGRMPEFLECFHKLLAKHQNVLRGRWENMWAAEPSSVVELIDPNDIFSKVVYALSNPVKDHLVERADQWPGASSLRANLEGGPLRATRPWRFFRKDGDMPESVRFSCVRPPGFEHLDRTGWRALLEEHLRTVEAAALAQRRAEGRKVLGRKTVLRQSPREWPRSREPRRQLNPRIAARNKWARIEALRRNRSFIDAYRAARALWQAGKEALFPLGTYWLRRYGGVATAPS
jgi:hypothetical protein